jgi:hypothetical protein
MRTLPYVRCCVFALLVMLTVGHSATSSAQIAVGITVGFAPPDLPVYEQPICPGDGFIWTPGFWAWDDDDGDYYWVPGTWVMAPEPGYLWTPAYWGWGGSDFVFYRGYWSFGVVGFYGGIDYGYGYFGRGYEGGRWEGDRFFYNRAVNNVNVTVIHNVYNTTVVNERNVTRVSYNGGNGGVNARPTPQEEEAAHGRRLPPAAPQRQHIQEARSNPQLRASVNRGKPPIAATPTPTAFSGRGVVPAREGGAVHGGPRNAGPGNAGRNNPPPENNTRRAVHPKDLPPIERPAASGNGNSRQDQKYQKQQEKMYAQQEKQRQKLQQRQDKEHQQLARQNANEGRKQQVEQRHQQQTEQLQQRHSQQEQKMQQRQPQSHSAPPPQKEKH